MALIKCKECGQRMSDRALKCPHCGAPAAMPTRAIVGSVLGGVMVAAALAGLLFVRGGGGEGGDPAMIGGGVIGIGAVVLGLVLVMLVMRLRGGSR